MKPGTLFDVSEDQYLMRNYDKMDTAALAKELGRTRSSTQSRLRHLGLRKIASDKPYQERVTILFDEDLMPRIRAGAEAAGLSMSGYVQELVRKGLLRKNKAV